MPQPSLGFVPSEPCSSSRSRTPLGAASFLAVLHRASIRSWTRAAVCPGFHRRPRLIDAVAWILTGASRAVSAAGVLPRPHGLPDAFSLARHERQVDVTCFVRFEAFFPPRSRTTAPAKRRAWPLLPWASAPPEPCSGRPSDPLTRRTVPSTRGLAHPRDDEGCDPSPSGEAGATSRPSDLVGASTRGATADRDVPPLGGIPPSLGLGGGVVGRRAPGPRRCEALSTSGPSP